MQYIITNMINEKDVYLHVCVFTGINEQNVPQLFYACGNMVRIKLLDIIIHFP